MRVAASTIDWEDLDIGPCAGGSCLYIADIGDNDAERDEIVIYRVREPDAGVLETPRPDSLRARFPDGARDAEALFTLPSGDLFVVSKGRGTDIALYRYPAPQESDVVTALERVRQLSRRPTNDRDRVTAAAATPDGRRVGIRTYRRLYLYDAAQLIGVGSLEPSIIDLAPLNESQGEGLALEDDGTVWLTSEAENRRSSALLNRLECAYAPL